MPQVIAHRALAMDSREFQRMGSEKLFAFGESWNAMFMQMFWEQQRLAISFVTAFWSAAFGIAGAGMAPVHRRALANARRLRRTRRR